MRTRGFTLLELLVVLAIAGLALAIAAPRLTQWASAAEERASLDVLRAQLEAQPREAFFTGASRTLEEALAARRLPPDWRVTSATPIVYESNGMTTGGRVKVWADAQLVAEWRILPPAGRIAAEHGP